MAKKTLNVFEIHVEKLLLGVVGSAVLVLVGTTVVTSPNTVELNGQRVGPKEIDQRVKGHAEALMVALGGAKHEAYTIENYPAIQAELHHCPVDEQELRQAGAFVPTSFGVPVPQVYSPGATGQVTLAPVVAPDKPEVTRGRISAIIFDSRPIGAEISHTEEDLKDLEGARDYSWVTVAARLDMRKQQQAFVAHNYQTNLMSIFVADVLLQRQERLGGGWGPWEDVDDYAPYVAPPPPSLSLERRGEDESFVPRADREALQEWLNSLAEFEPDLVRPQLPDAEFGRQWRPPLLRKFLKHHAEEFEGITPEPSQQAKAKTRSVNPGRQAKLDLQSLEKLVQEGQWEAAMNLANKIVKNKKATRTVKNRAKELQAEIEQGFDELERQEILAESRDGDGETPDQDVEERVTEYYFLANDLSARPGATYRYRLRLRAYNAYATITHRLKDPQDATRVLIEGEWSEPSDPVEVPTRQHLFLTREDLAEQEARFDVYKWTKGEWVKHQFTVRIGEGIGKKHPVSHSSKKKGKITVDFSTGVTLVDVLPERVYVPLKRQRDGSVVAGEPEATPGALCHRDQDGVIFERLLAADKADPEKRRIEKEMKELSRRTRRR